MPRSLIEAVGKALAAGVVAFSVGMVVVKAGPSIAPFVPHTQARPTIEPTVGYSIEVQIGQGAPSTLRIGDRGEGCEALERTDFLTRVCVLATTVDPAYIAGEAFGHINAGYSAPFEAVVWRGRLSRGAAACAEAGLEGDLLARCQVSVRQPTYTVRDSGVTVTVPSGAATSG